MDGRAEETERTHFIDDAAVEFFVVVGLDDPRQQLLLGVLPGRIAYKALVLGELALEKQRVTVEYGGGEYQVRTPVGLTRAHARACDIGEHRRRG